MVDIVGLRKWQKKFKDAIRIAKQKHRSRFMVLVTPAGGKASVPYLAKMFADIDAPICWLTPRESLCDGGGEIPGWLSQYCNQHLITKPVFRVSGNEKDPRRGTDGYITTYQGVVSDIQLHIQEFERQARNGEPYILVLDEVQFLADEDQVWGDKVHQLIERCGILIVMSGTAFRTDGRRLPLLPYRKNDAGDVELDLNHSDWETIIYTRREAILDRTIIPIELIYRDARGEFFNRWGKRKVFASMDEMKSKSDKRDVLRTVLTQQNARMIMDGMLQNWIRARRGHASKQALIIAESQDRAQEYIGWIKQDYPGFRVGLAITREGPANRATVKDFRHGKIDILVTVGVAHVGMDAIRVSHIALLTAVRARGWLEQAIARGVRFDPEAGPWEKQRCAVWTVDDPLLVAVMGRIEEEQIEALAEQGIIHVPVGEEDQPLPNFAGGLDLDGHPLPQGEGGDLGGADGEGVGGGPDMPLPPDEDAEGPRGADNVVGHPAFIPLYSELTDMRAHELNKIKLDRETSNHFAAVAEKFGTGMTPIETAQMLDALLNIPPDEAVHRAAITIGIRDVENKLREAIQHSCSKLDARRNQPFGTTNAHIKHKFGKSREDMKIAELQAVWAYLNMLWDREDEEEG